MVKYNNEVLNMENETKRENDNTNVEVILKKLSKYLVLICVLLVVLIIRLEKANTYLRTIAENNTKILEYETFDDTFIEVETEDKKEKDLERQNKLIELGYKVIRFWDNDVFKNMKDVLENIYVELKNEK